MSGGTRYARWIALALGAALSTFWLTSRGRHASESAEIPAAPLPSGESPVVDAALSRALVQAKKCGPGETSTGLTEVSVTFAPTGKVTSAEVAGQSPTSESVRACILSHLRSLEIPAFEGDEIRVRREVELGR